jgi:flavin-dependent dehydrogenase
MARARGAELRCGLAVRRISEGAVEVGEGEPLRAPHILLATGKHDVRGWPRECGSGGMVGFKQHRSLHARGAGALGNAVEVHLFDGGYAGLLPIGSAYANLCLTVSERRLARSGRTLEGLLAEIAPPGSILAERLDGGEPVGRTAAVSRIPYGYRTWRAQPNPDWLWRLGDQAAVTPSFTGDGMAIALRSAELAADTLICNGIQAEYRAALGSSIGSQMRRANMLDGLLASPAMAGIALRLAAFAPGLLRSLASATRLAG